MSSFCFLLSKIDAQKHTQSNVLKYGISGLFDLDLQFEYERIIKNNHSFQLELAIGIPRNIPKVYTDPFEQTGESSIGTPTIQSLYAFTFSETTTHLAFGILPEYRFYPLRRYAAKGFYLGAYLKFKYKSYAGAYTYRNDNEKNIDGMATSNAIAIGGGFSTGYQIILGKNICLDLGVGIGANHHIINSSYRTSATNETIETFQKHVESAISGIPVAGQHMTTVTTASDLISVKGAFPHIDIRPTISLGVVF